MRDGYQKDFLPSFNIELPKPSLSLSGDVLQPPGLLDGNVVIPYIHYSLIMSKSTKQALFSAANVDNAIAQTVSGYKGRKWFIDARVGRNNQITNSAYIGTPWDRGHLTRRTAVTWGITIQHYLLAMIAVLILMLLCNISVLMKTNGVYQKQRFLNSVYQKTIN
ncbi:DNA/RNA non-specific endonuclease [Colwellia sp. Arc7-D]|uniref:DNA/RNA non-specific endonuclease n=1 Tax=Colwellia sp. Arc7-D TaxID=2161872 RepID=UPI000D3D9082|nr:DNA/RNA non-specific endonuclease [Colwellia sp. Arc7-D]AWB57071.1 hypothetical protein DBO93_05545 [Colwellia sp. Arc7-D]